MRALRRLPLRARLVAGFAASMLVVLAAASAFVFWRVQAALDHRLDDDLASAAGDLRDAAERLPPARAIAALASQGRDAQLLDAGGGVVAAGTAAGGRPLLTPAEARRALVAPIRVERGGIFSARGDHLRITAGPLPPGGRAAVAVTAIRMDQRDEALRELLAQLLTANLAALAIASFVGYRLAHAALDPVEEYRAQAERVAQGATAVRLAVPSGPDDEITRLGQTLNAMLDAQERSAERQRQFIDDASHELRTPLAVQAAEIELALRKTRTADEHEATLRRLSSSTRELIGLAEDLLTLGALGSATPAAEDLRAADLLEDVATRARAQAGGRLVTVAGGSDVTVHADRALLLRALGNAAENALRYGGPVIALGAWADGEGAVVLEVHDDGPGMPADLLPQATERFRRGAHARATPGAGLGLAIVEAIATAHGGQLRICAAGRHHHGPTPSPALEGVPCRHAEDGTTVGMLLPARTDAPPTG